MDKIDWIKYHYKKENIMKPRSVLLKAKKFFNFKFDSRQKFAIDLGCGTGSATLALLRENWKIYAVDFSPDAIMLLEKKLPEQLKDRVTLVLDSFEKIIQLPQCDLVHAVNSLPFCNPKYFDQFFKIVLDSIRSEGIFCGTFFGHRDDWSNRNDMVFSTAQQLEAYFLKFNFSIKLFEEEQYDRSDVLGNMKHWHVFSCICKKI